MGVRRGLAIAAALTLSACVSAPAVPLRGTPSQLSSLTGEWDGTYGSRATGRSGSIWFKLIEGEDHAHGDVLMTATGAPAPYRRYPRDIDAYGQRPRTDTFLTIHFVRAADGIVDGVLDPYWDGACECLVVTAFRGVVTDNKVRGTFISRFADSVATGTWEATRRPAGKR